MIYSRGSSVKQKSLGQSIMVLDFFDECNGYFLHVGDCVMIKVHKDGYFNGDSSMQQVEKAVDIFETKYPHAHGRFLFDNAPLHKKIADDHLNAEKMNAVPGGKQPILRDMNAEKMREKLNTSEDFKAQKIILEEMFVYIIPNITVNLHMQPY